MQDKLEKLSVSDGLRAVKFAEVVVVLLDAAIPFEQQDLRIADLAEREGRAVVVAVNKWDIEEDRQGKLRELKEAFDRLLPQLRGAPLVTVSARTGKGLDRLRDAVQKAHEVWNRRIPTAQLNRWLAGMVEQHPPPAPGGRRIKLHDPGQDPAAGLRGDVLASRQDARELSPLPRWRPAYRFRHAGHAHPPAPAQPVRQEPLQVPEKAGPVAAAQAPVMRSAPAAALSG